jgi:DNA-binding NtrC family response regulator
MKCNKHILLADRNPHICDFITRELIGEGYRVFSVRSFAQLRKLICNFHPFDLLVIDPNFPEAESNSCLESLLDQLDGTPVILHGFAADCPLTLLIRFRENFIEKNGHSITDLKAKIQGYFDMKKDILNPMP